MPIRVLVIGLVLLILVSATHLYLHRRLVVAPKWPVAVRRSLTVLIATLALGLLVALPAGRLLARETISGFFFAAMVWMGVLFYLLLFVGTADAVRLVSRLVGKKKSGPVGTEAEPPPNAEAGELPRRVVLQRAVAGAAVVGSAATATFGVRRALVDIDSPTVEIRIDRLPPQLSGFRIALLSDIHIGPLLDKRFLGYVVERANALKPDMVAITGDLVDGSVQNLGRDVAELTNLKSRYGTFFVTGNHEYYSGAQAWVEFLNSIGVRVLDNERLLIGDASAAGAQIQLVGVHDRHAVRASTRLKPDWDRAFAEVEDQNCSVLLAHQPKDIYNAAAKGACLQLSGHTHGGQLWPFGAAAAIANPYLAGLHNHEDTTQIYVTRGTGFWGPPMRVFAPPEVTEIILV